MDDSQSGMSASGAGIAPIPQAIHSDSFEIASTAASGVAPAVPAVHGDIATQITASITNTLLAQLGGIADGAVTSAVQASHAALESRWSVAIAEVDE